MEKECHRWIYFEIFRGCYGLPQSGKLSNDLLITILEDAHYYEDKDDPNRTRITITGGHILVHFDVSTPTGSLELVKLIINSVLSRQNARFSAFDIKNFYLNTPM